MVISNVTILFCKNCDILEYCNVTVLFCNIKLAYDSLEKDWIDKFKFGLIYYILFNLGIR